MHPNRRRKKRPNYGLKTVEVMRGPNGFGFTISGQQPCILSCIVANSPADQAGLRAGDFLISVNGISVSKITHDAVVNLIGNSVGPIKMTIADNYFSDSSDEELECSRVVNRKPKYINKSKARRNLNRSSLVQKQNVNVPMEQEAGPIEYKALVGYLGTIELPKQLLPNSRLRTVCSCIRKLKQEKRAPTAMVMTVLPTCLTLKNSGNQIIAIYPTNRVIYVGTTADKESKYFGVITTTAEKGNNIDSCHIFVVNPKIIDHNIHKSRAENFKIKCTKNPVTGYCMEFPGSALYVVSIIQNMYKLETSEKCYNFGPLVANSPQPSASSNSDSGIGFRDDFGNISDRILVVEFPQHRPFPFQTTNKRPSGIDASNLFLEGLDLPLDDTTYHHQQQQNIFSKNVDKKHLNNLNNIRACESKKPVSYTNTNNINITPKKNSDSSDDNTQSIDVETYRERAIDCPESPQKFSLKEIATNLDSKSGSCDDISMHSSKSNELSNLLSIFKVPFDVKKIKKQSKMASSDDLYKSNLINDKLSPKVYGYRPNYSCEELNNLDVTDKLGFGSLQDLRGSGSKRKNVLLEQEAIEGSAKSEEMCDDQSFVKCNYAEGPSAWSGSFEKLLGDPLGLHMFAEFLKKEFSAENIYFWIACERFKNLTSEVDRLNEVTRIYRQHLSAGAPEAVNVDAQARQGVEKQLQSLPSNYVTHSHNHTRFYKIQDSVNDDTENDKQQQTIAADLLAQAQKQIFNLMKFDSYPRFLRSEIYRKCLVGESEKVPVDVRLLLQPATPTKLKKSVSNAEDRRRKSLLPWHRKNRSKSKDRGESDCTKRNPEDDSLNNVEQDHVHSSGSSLTSLDLAIPPQSGKQNHHDDLTSNVCRTSLCRVLLSNGSTTVVQIKNSETIQQLVTRLLEKRGLQYSSFEVYTDKHLKCVNVEDSSMTLAGCEVTVEQRAVFKLDLPNKKMISIRSKYTKIIIDVLRPSLHKYHYNLDQVVVLNGNDPIDLHQPVTSIDGMKLKVVFKTDFRCDSGQHNSRQPNHKIKLDEITNKVFEGILQEKGDSTIYKPEKSERGSVKSEDWGSEHSSTFIGKFLRRDSGIHDKKKKMQMRYKGGVEDVSSEHTKKPLIAKLTSGANKFNVSCSESDELVEGLSRAQRRIEDQRGTEINFELPDFLKNKENDHQPRHSTTQEPTTKFFLGDNSSPSNSDKNKRIPVISSAKNMKLELQSNYENRTVLLPNNYVNDETPVNVKSLSPVESEVRRSSVEPPPLPPKPKVVPIKPPNWGQTNGFFMNKEDRKQPQMFLEKASSSFV